MHQESDLYKPVCDFLESKGFVVKPEINSHDIVAVSSKEIVIVELKNKFSTKLIFQAIKAKEKTENVFVALPKKSLTTQTTRQIVDLLSRLDITLLVVHFRESGDFVEVKKEKVSKIDNKKRKKLLKEFSSRRFDPDRGGINRQKIPTLYREKSISIAAFLKLKDIPCSTKEIRECTNIEESTKILQNNVHKMFDRTKRGYYRFCKEKEEALANYNMFSDIVNYYEKKYLDSLGN